MKTFLWIILTIGLLTVTIGLVMISNFELFGDPKREIINLNCDFEGLRQTITYTYTSNAVTNPSIHVSASAPCSNKSNIKNEVLIFTADHHSLTGAELTTEWISFDTLLITYDSKMRVLSRNMYVDLSSPIIVTYREK